MPICPILQKLPNFCQIVNKVFKNCPNTFLQNYRGENLPHLVTLLPTFGLQITFKRMKSNYENAYVNSPMKAA